MMNSMINTACQTMNTQGFTGFYHSLVAQFSPNMPLTSENDALFYSVAYGMSHYVTFRTVLADNIRIDDNDTVLNIIDYGCGQGVATLATLEHIASQKDPKTVHLDIHLIDPSSIALENASYQVLSLTQAYGFSATISTQNCYLAEASVPKFNNGADNLHLMSYILDVRTIQGQLSNITTQIHQLSGVNHIVATDIDQTDAYTGFNLLSHQLTGSTQAFTKYQPQHMSYRVIQQRYQRENARAIGMVLSLDNQSDFAQVA